MNTMFEHLHLTDLPFAARCRFSVRFCRTFLVSLMGCVALIGLTPLASAATEAAPAHGVAPTAAAHAPEKKSSAADGASEEKSVAVDIKAALREQMLGKKGIMLVVRDKSSAKSGASSEDAPEPAHATPAAHAAVATAADHAPARVITVHTSAAHATPAFNARSSRAYIRAKAAALTGHEVADVSASETHGATAHGSDAHAGEPHWAYEGENGPQNWGKLKPEFNLCAIGKRQSPINIEESATLQGPAEPLQFNYTPSIGSVVNNGHTIQVDVAGDNTLTVRGSVYKLVQFHFHTPSEEQVNFRNFAMVAHLVHKNNEGQLAVVAVLLDPGVANALINKVWTYMPLDTSDRVRMPDGLIDMNELLPKDQRYYQFIGSLTTPPCTEGVLWMVMKQPTLLSREQIRLFQQLFPNNARPVQPVNARAVRNAQ